jgi:hypothetical protein
MSHCHHGRRRPGDRKDPGDLLVPSENLDVLDERLGFNRCGKLWRTPPHQGSGLSDAPRSCFQTQFVMRSSIMHWQHGPRISYHRPRLDTGCTSGQQEEGGRRNSLRLLSMLWHWVKM